MTDDDIIDQFLEKLKSSDNGQYDFQSFVWSKLEKDTLRLDELDEKLKGKERVTPVPNKHFPLTYRLKSNQETRKDELIKKDEHRKDKSLELTENANKIASKAYAKSSNANKIAIATIVVTVLLNIGGVLLKKDQSTDIKEEQTLFRDSIRTVIDQQKSTLDSLRNILLSPQSDTLK